MQKVRNAVVIAANLLLLDGAAPLDSQQPRALSSVRNPRATCHRRAAAAVARAAAALADALLENAIT